MVCQVLIRNWLEAEDGNCNWFAWAGILIDLPQLRTEISYLKRNATPFKLFRHVIAVPRDRIRSQRQKPGICDLVVPSIIWGALPDFTSHFTNLRLRSWVSSFREELSKFTSIDRYVLRHRNNICGFFRTVAFPYNSFQHAGQHFGRFKLICQARENKAQQVRLEYVCSQNKCPWKTLTLVQIGNVIWAPSEEG